ncbi:MAG TPA: Uma2 family endonuclease [Chloroflexota bacterium]|jgi:Uma2 family endonuclease|nr:Uma2 family endonuclease [Chloroflexota bacterium]
MAVERRLITADELLAMPDDAQRRELINGKLRMAPPAGWEHGQIASELGASLRQFAREHRLGHVVMGDVGFLLTTEPDTVRAPDVAFLRQALVDAAGRVTGYWPGAPDIAIEVVSPNDLYTEVDEKVASWIEHGCTVVFVVNPRRRSVMEYRSGAPVVLYDQSDILRESTFLPGWEIVLSDLFQQT